VTYADPHVCFSASQSFIPLRVDFNKNKALVKRFGVKWTPSIVMTDSDGDEHHRFIGYLPPKEFTSQILLGAGKTEYDLDHPEAAMQRFQEILVRFPQTEAAPEAQYFVAVTKYGQSRDPRELKLGLEVLQRDYPQSEWTEKARVFALIPS